MGDSGAMQQDFIDGAQRDAAQESGRGAADTARVAGTVKWYDRGRGYGFIVPDDGGPDVFLGQAVVELAGFGHPDEGCRVEAAMQVRARGRSATALLRLVRPEPVDDGRSGRRTRSDRLTDISGPRRGVVKMIKRERGFGFVTLGDGTPDIFFHFSVRGTGVRTLEEGDAVEVSWGSGPEGLMAVEIVRAGERQMLRSA